MSIGKSKTVVIESRTSKMISTLISDYPELGYGTVDEFVGEAIIELLKKKSLEIGHLQTWMKKGS